jgi:hypothetical protein
MFIYVCIFAIFDFAGGVAGVRAGAIIHFSDVFAQKAQRLAFHRVVHIFGQLLQVNVGEVIGGALSYHVYAGDFQYGSALFGLF